MDNFSWLDRFGKTATFIKNDLRLLKRSKRARTAVYMGIGVLFYGLYLIRLKIFGHSGLFLATCFLQEGFCLCLDHSFQAGTANITLL